MLTFMLAELVLVALVALGSALGAGLRFTVTRWIHSGDLPWGTLVVNLSGATLAGALLAWPVTASGTFAAAFLVAGVLGGYTTVSTLALQVWRLLENRGLWQALGWLVLTAVGSLALSAGARQLALGVVA